MLTVTPLPRKAVGAGHTLGVYLGIPGYSQPVAADAGLLEYTALAIVVVPECRLSPRCRGTAAPLCSLVCLPAIS